MDRYSLEAQILGAAGYGLAGSVQLGRYEADRVFGEETAARLGFSDPPLLTFGATTWGVRVPLPLLRSQGAGLRVAAGIGVFMGQGTMLTNLDSPIRLGGGTRLATTTEIGIGLVRRRAPWTEVRLGASHISQVGFRLVPSIAVGFCF